MTDSPRQMQNQWAVGDPIEGEEARLFETQEEAMRFIFWRQETQIAKLEKENRKLNDKLNRFRNLTPGRKRLYTLGRVATMMEACADGVDTYFPDDLRHDALYLHRLQWDFEQLREVVYPSDTPSHEWRRP